MTGLLKDKEGYYYQSETTKYNIFHGVTVGGEKTYTSDLGFIMETDQNGYKWFVDYFFGIEFIESSEDYLKNVIERYESKKNNSVDLNRFGHINKILQAYLATNEEFMNEEPEEVENIKKDIKYLSTLIQILGDKKNA